ncbi:MAG: TonB-dependent receptor [Chitinophagaceae bacterium]
MKKLIFIILFISSINVLFSQSIKLRGQVTDLITNEHLADASIINKQTNKTYTSDKDGYFIITDAKSGVLNIIISFAGYETTEIFINDENREKFIQVKLSATYKAGEEIVISATKRPEKITSAPASIQVIGQKQLQQFSGSNVGELFAYVQGIEFVRTGVDGISFNARGLNNAFNNKMFQIVDGRNSMNPLSGSLMMGNNSSVNKDDIERIEILIGPQTALYGPNVHNALINYITKDPRKYQGTTLSISAGNQYQFSGRLRQAAKINKRWAYKLTGEYAVGREFEFYDSVYAGGGIFGPVVAIPERIDFNFRHIRGEAHVYYSVTPKADIILSTGGSNNNNINTQTVGHNQFVGVTNSFIQLRYNSPRFFATVYNAWADFGKSYSVLGYTRDFWNRTHSTALIGPNARLSPEDAEIFAMRPGNSFKETPQRINAEAQYNYNFVKQKLIIVGGLSYQKDKPRGYGINLVDSFQRIFVSQYGAVLQLEKTLLWDIQFYGATRLDNHSNFGNFFSPKVGLVRAIAQGKFRVTWGRAYSMPSVLFQYARTGGLFFGNGEGIRYIPNGAKFSDPGSLKITQPLVPEKISTWEIGYKGTFFKKLYIDVAYYNGNSKNFFSPSVAVAGRAISVGENRVSHNPLFAGMPVNDTLRNANFITVFNFGKVKVYGIDAGLSYDFNKIINLALRYSWMGSDITKGDISNDANKDGQVLADEKSLNSPENRGVVILSFQNLLKRKGFASISARYVQEYDFYSGNQISTKDGAGIRGVVQGLNGTPRYVKNYNWGPLGGFTTVDLRAGYKLNSNVDVALGITNLFNTEQREFAGSPLIKRLFSVEVKLNVPDMANK